MSIVMLPIACVCIVIALVLYFFYWNRFIASLIGQAIRILYWNQERSSIWIEIGSIHFSLLAGRILFKDVRYHSSNQTVKIVKGQIQWRYWIRRPTSEEELNSLRGENAQLSGRLWSCRIQFSLQGVEWFLYNRTTAYDNIIAQMEKATRPASRSSSHFRFFRRFSRQNSSQVDSSASRAILRMPSFVVKGFSWISKQMPSFDSKDLLPLGIRIQKGVIILGNPSTPTLLVAEFQNAIGTYGVVPSRSKYDYYKQVLGLHFQSALIRLVDNDDFVDPMTILGGLIHSRTKSHSSAGRPLFYHSYRLFTRLWRQLGLERLTADYFATRRAQRLAHKSLATSLPGFKTSRAVETETPIGIDFSSYEYAIERKILETPALEVTYYVDVAGEVPSDSSTSYSRGGLCDVGNRDTDPEWGFDVVIFGGTLRYGPWADRQRVELQRTFFPPVYQDHDVSSQLKPGDKRVWSALKVLVELRNETSLHIPFREPSKDWQWDGLAEIPHRPRKREPAFFSVIVGDRSSISYILPMVIGPSGYESVLEVHLDTMTITSSLNDIRLISAESSRVHGELPAPLQWNGDRTWTFAASLRHPTLYLLRDHINMFSDLGRDWLSGPPTDYQKFIPMTYAFQLDMQHYEANFYVNDHNIIDRPLIREENALLTMRGPTLRTSATILSNTFRPESTSIPFTVSAPGLVGNFSLPRWSTHALYAQKDGISLFKTESFNINGSYRFFAEVRDEHVEQLKLDFNMNKTVFRAFGWAIRYFLVFRENYFGSFTQFQTLSEYLEKRTENLPIGDPLKSKYRPEKSNMLEVEISVRAERATILLPTSLIGASAHAFDDNTFAKAVSFTIPEIQLQLRLHDYYMEMSLNYDRITASVLQDSTGHVEPTTPHQIFTIDGIDIVANRLFGPQPRTAVYLCIWEVTFGDIKASMSANQSEMLFAASNAFRYNFIDLVNAPAQDFAPALDPDVTFYKISVKSIEANWTVGQAVLHLQLPKGIKFDRNDLGSTLYKRVNSLRVPLVSCKILLTSSAERKTWLEAAEFSIDVDLDIYSVPHNYQAQTNAQLAFLDEQDRITGRAKRIFARLRQRRNVEPPPDRLLYRRGVYLPQPTLPRRTPALAKSPVHNNKRSGHPPLHIPTLASLSDTDGEEGVSEADRDARLARTRTSTPMQTQDDDVAMSSGDESDDADLTDGYSSEDDWSDVGESSQNQEIASLMSFYSPVVRHYTANDLSGPDFWDLPTFELKRDAAIFMRRVGGATGDPNPSSFPMHKLSDEDVGETDTTTLRLKCQLATVTFTPLALPALFLLEEDLQMIMPDSERTVDSLLGRCITKILTKNVPTCSILQMNIHRAAFRVVQHVASLEDGHPDILKAQQSPSLPTNLDILSIVELNAAGACVSGVFRHKNSVISASLGELSGSVDTSVDKRTVKPKSTILYLAFASPFIRFAPNGLHADLGSISVEVGHNGPELVTAVMLALGSSTLRLAKGMKEVQALQLRKQRAIIATILSQSQARPVVDPLSTIQPSYLVQSGDPQSLRTDVSFKFLYHLRNCLRLTKLLDEPLRNEINVEELTSLIEARLMHLDPESSSIDHLTSLDPSFLENLANSRLLSPTPAISTFGMRLGSMRITVPAPLDGPPGELDISEVAVDLQFRKQHLVQFNLNNPSSASQTSLRAKSSKVVRNTGVIASIGDINLIIVPHLMNFAQHILRVTKQVEGILSDNSTRKRTPLDGLERTPKVIHTELIGTLRRLRIRAAAENLVLVMGLDGLRTAMAVLAIQSKPLSINSNVLFEELSLQARSPSTSNQDSDYDLLAGLSFTKGYSSIVSRPDSRSRENVKVVVSLAGLKLHVPRSALRLYRFIEEWRADYLPGLEATLNTLLSEYRASPNPPRSPTASQQFQSNAVIQAHGQIENLEVSLQVMHGTWLLWEMHKTVAYIHSSGNSMLATNYSFGVQVDSMVLNVSSKPNATDAAPRSRAKVALPPLSVAGHTDGLQIHMLVLLESIDLKVKPSHWDTLLAVQQKFGQDFNDLLVLMQKTRHAHRAPSAQTSTSKALQYIAHIRMQGLRIGLVGLSSTLFLECQDINGGFTSTDGWTWDLSLSDLALSLAPRVTGRQTTAFNRRQRSAFVIIDANLSGSNRPGNDKNLRLSVSKIQAVMQPSSIGEFGDFIDNLQAEMFERQEQRALELTAFKVKAQSILQTFDVNVGDVQLEKSSWLDDLIITLSIRNVGIAFPLTHDEDLHFSRNKTKESAAIRAFLFCIKSIHFTASRGETGQATLQRLSFQFVPRFRQSSADDFTAEKHQTRNCLLYPDMRAQLQTSTSGSSRKVWIKADVSGFILDIDSAIPSYVFSLIDVYRQGKERVERMSSIAPRTPLSALPVMENVKPSLEKRYTAVPTSNVFGHLTFLSGKVRFYSTSASDEFKNRTPLSQILLDIPDDQVLDLGAEVLNLPVVSVWIEYRATPASQKLVKDSELEPSLLIFKSTIHSSQNTLRPSLLPFLTELVSRIETRMRKVSSHFPVPPPPSGASQDRRQEMDLVSSMQISFSLRIDKSTMELTCQPDVNVVAGLNWESGGFIVNISPGARKVFFSGSVGGLTLGLKHGFLSEDCVKLDARNVVFSVSFTKTEFDGGSVNSISVVLDTEFLGGVRFSRLQDILCFKAVWLDRIPVLDSQIVIESKTPIKPTFAEDPPATRGFSTAILIRIRQIALEVDLGQSVSRLNLDLNQTIFRTTLKDDRSEVFLYIANVSISAQGNISGQASVPSCVFQTIRRSEQALLEDQGKSCMLELRLTSGALIADFESDYHNLLHYRAEPLKVEVLDDWSQMQAAVNDKTRPVDLTFTVTCPDIVSVITVGTIPKFLSYMNKFQANLDIQRQGAFRESQTFRVTWTPKPDNPLSAVGEAMLQSARNRFKETGVSLVVRQHLRVRFDLLRLIVFPRTMKDLEIAQFSARDVWARLDGLAVANSPSAERNLHLSFSSMVISKYNRSRPVPQRLGKLEDDGREWLTALFQDASETNIVGLPSMKMHMISGETVGEFTRTLTYDFFSEFVRREGMKAFEDIYITLNVSLYAWLTVLRKNLSREMDQVKASEDWRASMNPSPAGIGSVSQRKRRVPDPLSLPLHEQSRLSTQQSGALSPSGPPSTRLGFLEGSTPASARDIRLSPTSFVSSPSPLQFPPARDGAETSPISQPPSKKKALIYEHRNRQIERLTMRQLGAATPDVMHPFFMKKAGFSLEDSLPQYVHEYATTPLEEILDILLKLYSRQLLAGKHRAPSPDDLDSSDATDS